MLLEEKLTGLLLLRSSAMMKKGFLLNTDNKKRRAQSRNEGGIDSDPPSVLRDEDRRYDKMHEEETASRGLSMNQGFLLQPSSSASRRQNNQEGRKGKKSTHLPKSIDDKNSVATTKSGTLLDLEAVDSDGAVATPSLFNVMATSEESKCCGNDRRDDEASEDCKQPIMVEIDDGPITDGNVHFRIDVKKKKILESALVVGEHYTEQMEL